MFPTLRPCAPLFLINVLVLTLISCPPIYIYLHVPQFCTPLGYIFCCTPLYIQCTTLFIQCTTHFIQCTTLLLNKYTTLLYHTKVHIFMYHTFICPTPSPTPFTSKLNFFHCGFLSFIHILALRRAWICFVPHVCAPLGHLYCVATLYKVNMPPF